MLLRSVDVLDIYVEPYIQSGFRPPNQPYSYYYRSLFSLHNETLSVWIHLLGTFVLLGQVYRQIQQLSSDGHSLEISLYLLYNCCGACAMLLFSAQAHLFHSRTLADHLRSFYLDYLGINFYGFTSGIILQKFSHREKWLVRSESHTVSTSVLSRRSGWSNGIERRCCLCLSWKCRRSALSFVHTICRLKSNTSPLLLSFFSFSCPMNHRITWHWVVCRCILCRSPASVKHSIVDLTHFHTRFCNVRVFSLFISIRYYRSSSPFFWPCLSRLTKKLCRNMREKLSSGTWCRFSRSSAVVWSSSARFPNVSVPVYSIFAVNLTIHFIWLSFSWPIVKATQFSKMRVRSRPVLFHWESFETPSTRWSFSVFNCWASISGFDWVDQPSNDDINPSWKRTRLTEDSKWFLSMLSHCWAQNRDRTPPVCITHQIFTCVFRFCYKIIKLRLSSSWWFVTA